MRRSNLEAAESLLRKRRAPVKGDDKRRFFQRWIVRSIILTDEQGPFIAGHVLSCGHTYQPVRRRPPSKRKTAVCYECGAGPRTQFERRIAARHFRDTLAASLSDERSDAVVEVMRCAILLAALRDGDLRESRLREDLRSAAMRCGLLEQAEKVAKRPDA